MPDSLSPLPSASPGLDGRFVKTPVWSSLSSPFPKETAGDFPLSNSLPAWPATSQPASPSHHPGWPSALPSVAPHLPTALEAAAATVIEGRPTSHPASPPVTPAHQFVESPQPDFTDAELSEAFAPIIEQAVRSAVVTKEHEMDAYLEPMLRATIRRALAESSPGSRPFHAPGAVDRFIWHLQALFTSRTYEEIIFEKTHRFQVGEVFLVDSNSLALVSFASCDPARHASPRRVENAVQRLAMQLRDENGKIRDSFELPDQRNVIARTGRFVTLLAVVRGRPSDLVIADLEFALNRIEERFRDQFLVQGSPLLHTLQPFLEDCLLIQAPASAA